MITRRSLLAAAAFGCAARPALSQTFGAPGFENVVGHEKQPHRETWLATAALAPAERQRFTARLARLRELLLAAPALRELKGHDWGTSSAVKDGAFAGRPLAGNVLYLAYPYTRDVKSGKPVSSYEGAPYTVHVNDPEALLPHRRYGEDDEARFAAEPSDAGWLVLGPDGVPPFVPVAQERWLGRRIELARREIADTEARFAAVPEDAQAGRRDADGRIAAWKQARAEAEQRWAVMQPEWPERVAAERARFDAKEAAALQAAQATASGSPRQRHTAAAQGRLQALEAQLAALSPAQRSERARLPNGPRIVTANPALFDARRPRSDVRLLVIGPTRYFPALYETVERQLDRAALRALIDA